MKTRIFLLAATVAVLLCWGGCRTLYKNYGSIVPDNNAMQTFESYRMDSDLNYYISGSDSFPNALMGLNKAYTLNSTLWKRIEMTPEVFRNLVSSMQAMASEVSSSQHGFAILDDKGRQIGIWYSLFEASTFIRMENENTVDINTPPLNTYERHEGRDKPERNY